MKAPVFIVGPHRSGSTLWHNLIAMGPGIMRLTDPRFLSDRRHADFRYFLRTKVGDLKVDEEVDKMVEICLSGKPTPGLDGVFWQFVRIDAAGDPELKRQICRRIKQSDRTLGSIARIFIEEITRFSGCERACVKFPVDVGHISELMEWFPGCKIVHITRDPRAVAMSKRNDPYGTAVKVLQHPRLAWLIRKLSVWLVIAQYREAARIHHRFQHVVNYQLFRYEDLLAKPEATVRSLCEFIDVEFTPDLLHPEEGIHLHQPSSLTGKQTKAFDSTAALRWQTVISPFDRWLITSLTTESMSILGYDPATHPIFRNSHPVSSNVCTQSA
jgi:Sulfotransferase family